MNYTRFSIYILNNLWPLVKISMKKKLFILFFAIKLLSAQFYPMAWGDPKTENDQNQLIHLKNWHLKTQTMARNIALPFVFENIDSLYLQNEFIVDDADSNMSWQFVTLGFLGKALIKINDQVIVNLPETQTKTRQTIPRRLIHPGKNQISIRLTIPRTFDSGFLQFAHLFTEPRVLGITRPFYIQKNTQDVILHFSYNLVFKNGVYKLNYSYDINPLIVSGLPNKNGLATDDFFGSKKLSHAINPANFHIEASLILKDTQLWSPENPTLMPVKIRLRRFGQVLGEYSFKTGFKDIRMEGRQIILNARPLQITGIIYHQNILSLSHRSILPTYRSDLQNIQRLGYNAVRFASHIPDDRILSLCDSLGLLTFVEFPVNNYPVEMFKRDDLLELISRASVNLFNQIAKHPSLTGLGLGSGTMTNVPPVQKFYYILKINLRKPAPILTYLIPLPAAVMMSSARLTDFYGLDIRDDVRSYLPFLRHTNRDFSLIASIGTPDGFYFEKNKDTATRMRSLRNDILVLQTSAGLQDGFIDAYADWNCSAPQIGTITTGRHYLLADGMVTQARKQKPGISGDLRNPWKNHLSVDNEMIPRHSTNIFSLIMFFSMIFFFLFYRRYPRFKENFNRALRHPYGFFVDMRERRIIPVFNTFITGAASALILATFIATFIYFFNGSYRFQEIVTTFVSNPSLLATVLEYSRSPLVLTSGFFILLYLHPLLIGLFLKLITLFSRIRLRLRQAIGVGMWAGLPWIFLFPVALAGFQILSHGGFLLYLIILFALFNFWSFYRLVNGIRIITLSKFRTVFIILLLSYVLPIIIFLLVFKSNFNWLTYLNYLIQSAPLFNG